MSVQTEAADIDFNPEFRRALDLMENTNRHVFVTGRAGTGKSTLLDYFRRHTERGVVVLAPMASPWSTSAARRSTPSSGSSRT